jgi:hypothetical protein
MFLIILTIPAVFTIVGLIWARTFFRTGPIGWRDAFWHLTASVLSLALGFFVLARLLPLAV